MLVRSLESWVGKSRCARGCCQSGCGSTPLSSGGLGLGIVCRFLDPSCCFIIYRGPLSYGPSTYSSVWWGHFEQRLPIPLLSSLLNRSSLSDATRLNRQRRLAGDFWRQCWLSSLSANRRLGEWIPSHICLCRGRHNAPGTRGRGSRRSRRRRSAPNTMWRSGQRPAII